MMSETVAAQSVTESKSNSIVLTAGAVCVRRTQILVAMPHIPSLPTNDFSAFHSSNSASHSLDASSERRTRTPISGSRSLAERAPANNETTSAWSWSAESASSSESWMWTASSRRVSSKIWR